MPRYEFMPPVVLALPLLIGALITGLDYPLTWDEPAYYSVLVTFGDNYFPTIDEVKNYRSTYSAPLSMIIYGFWGRIFGFDPWKLRILSVFFSFGAILVFYQISKSLLKKYNSPVNPLHLALLLMFNPYYFATSFLIFSDLTARFFFMMALLYYVKDRPMTSGFFSGLAVLSRQFYLFLPAAIFLYLLMEKKQFFFKSRQFFGVLLPLTMFFPFFFLWDWQLSRAGGPSMLSLDLFNYHIATLAFYSLPVLTLISLRKFLDKRHLLFSLASLPLLAIKIPAFSYTVGILYFAYSALGEFGIIPLVLLWLIGILILIQLTNFNFQARDKLLPIGIIIFTIMISFTPGISDKYLLTILPLIFLAFASQATSKNKVLLFWIIILIICTAAYSYLVFFKLINQI